MTGDKGTPSGNMGLLAAAMRKAFGETVETDPEPARENSEGEESHPDHRISD